jgi:hypothetical protein
MATRKPVIIGWLAASSIFLSGCNVVIEGPALTGSVEVTLPYFYRKGTFKARQNKVDITSRFTVDAQNRKARGSLDITPGLPGTHVLDVTACWGIDVVFVMQPPWPLRGCSHAQATLTTSLGEPFPPPGG